MKSQLAFAPNHLTRRNSEIEDVNVKVNAMTAQKPQANNQVFLDHFRSNKLPNIPPASTIAKKPITTATAENSSEEKSEFRDISCI